MNSLYFKTIIRYYRNINYYYYFYSKQPNQYKKKRIGHWVGISQQWWKFIHRRFMR